jgi:hypothetical protein
MGQNARQTVEEIERTREQLGHKVDEFVDAAKVQAGQVGKKVAIGLVVLTGIVALGWFAKSRVQD